MIDKNNKFLIVGLGLIGGSYAEGLSKAGYEVGALSLSKDDIDFAMSAGFIKSGRTNLDKEYISNFDIVIFALYPGVFVNWIKDNQHLLKSGALLTDVTGVKKSVVYDIQSILRSDLEFVAAHPMAGREVSGVKNADANIFKNANYIVTPTDKNTKEAVETVKAIGEILGFRNISTLSPEEHDEMIAFLSQLTHCIAMSLMTYKDSEHYQRFTGDSFRDLTRIANINENLWPELFIKNKDELVKQIDGFLKELEDLKELIKNEDVDKMKEKMILSTNRRKAFDKK